VCSNGDFPIASSNNGHQVLGAKVANPKTSHYIFGNIYIFFSLYAIYSLLLDFTIWQNFTQKKKLFEKFQFDKQQTNKYYR
jgi:hypothetical protein